MPIILTKRPIKVNTLAVQSFKKSPKHSQSFSSEQNAFVRSAGFFFRLNPPAEKVNTPVI